MVDDQVDDDHAGAGVDDEHDDDDEDGPMSSSARTTVRISTRVSRIASPTGRLDLNEPFLDDPRPLSRAATSRGRTGRGPGARVPVARKPAGRRSRSFVTLLSLVLVLNLVGLAMVLSASSVTSAAVYGSSWYQLWRQMLWCGMGLVVLVFALRRDYRRWQNHSGLGVIAVLVLLGLVLVPQVGMDVNGAQRWLGYGAITVQPSELTKLALIVFWADLLARRAKWIDEARLTLIPVVMVFLAAAVLILLQPNLGTTAIIFGIMVTMLFVGGAPIRWIGGLGIVGATTVAGFAVLFRWRWARLVAFNDPWADAQNTGYQPIQAQTAAATGGLWGTGLGQGRAKWGFLPEANTDFIFSVIAEEAGFIGALVVIGLFIALGITGVRVAMRAPDRFGMLLATGITSWFLIQAFLNIGQSVGRLPVMGVPLPFVSSGGSSLIVSMLAAGMLLNIARQTN